MENKLKFQTSNSKGQLKHAVKLVNTLKANNTNPKYTDNQATVEAFNIAVMGYKLGLTERKIEAIKVLADAKNVTIDTMFDALISNYVNKLAATEILSENKEAIIKDNSINTKGSASIRIEHYVSIIKEHNNNSEHKIKVSQTLISEGLKKEGRIFDLSLLGSSNNELLVNGANCNRKAIKEYMTLNKVEISEVNSFNDLSVRKNNIQTIKALTK